jgi:hypothetical protein
MLVNKFYSIILSQVLYCFNGYNVIHFLQTGTFYKIEQRIWVTRDPEDGFIYFRKYRMPAGEQVIDVCEGNGE